jgi:hypothetical protein
MLLVNPHTGKLVDVAEAFVDQLSRAGFKEQEPEVVAPVEAVVAPRARRARKSAN